jgi:N,N'-diacetyllegionaminate synthase
MITLKSGRKIGPGQPPYIIAEVGSNWQTLDDCKLSIAMAKRAGADAVKFQAFTHEALYGRPEPTVVEDDGLDGPNRPNFVTTVQRLPGVLPLDWLPILAEKARVTGIDFLCSAFSPELVSAVDPFVEMHKVASAELSHVRLLEAVRATGKPVLLSTGASTPGDIQQAHDVLRGAGQVVLLYCVASYPATDIDFRHMDKLREFGCPVGYSDHSTDSLVIPKAAIDWGACVLEKHFTAIEAATPDRPHSLTVDQFKRMVLSIRGELPFAWGSGEENDMRIRHNRRLVATRDVQPGEALSESGNFGIYRSLKSDTRGLSGFAASAVHDKRATRAIQAGEAIGPGDFT